MTGTRYADDDVALMLEGVSRKLEDGHITQAAAAERLATLLAELDGTTTYRGLVKSQGRVSFGRGNEGRDGVAIFVPTTDE
jgi:hypothetical protein